ncbi:glucokinase [Falsirhodobacter sp. 20TX0035]|uniref:glucokinase n=1 Tax=Falsirhodobacter sp. 20TX0035 TaxID=3022019 RepID=UPI002330809F|nr:glucokinase [Falsirhodobacter sp. 20TX0035]MDB6453200.1 glucokinase [Falsirhodobacter sp. 20TX0035]
MSSLSLVADVGGTNTRIALAEGFHVRHDSVRRFTNADFTGLDAVILRYLDDLQETVDAACAAIAGPVTAGVGTLTNLDWTVDGMMLRAVTGAGAVSVLNDLQAQGHALGHVPLRPILPGRAPADPAAARLVVGVGTGFNAAPVHVIPGGRLVPPSESGHVNLPVRTAEEVRLGRHLEDIYGIATVEEALSGRGLSAIHGCVTGTERPSKDIIPLIGTDADATETARIFVRLLGSVVGNLGLTHLPFGGIALCGGMSRAMAPHLDALGFAEAMHDKGRFSDFVSAFPVSVIEDDYAALTGCAASIM